MGGGGFVDSSAEEMTGNRRRERGRDMQQRASGQDSNLGSYSEDKAFAQGTPSLPAELNGAP